MDPVFVECLIQTLNEDWRTDRRIRGRCIAVATTILDQGRNAVVREFLGHLDRPDWLLMVDTDMTWSPTDLRNLFQAADEEERPVIAGLTFSGHPETGAVWPVIFEVTKNGPQRREDYPRNAVFPIDATGAAFLLVHRRVFEDIAEAVGPDHPAPWFAFSALGSLPIGEDVYFFLACMRRGVQAYMHSGVKVGHRKKRELNEAAWDSWRESQAGKRRALEAVL
jgi:hypothetical protein